jgi:hypothetical protein
MEVVTEKNHRVNINYIDSQARIQIPKSQDIELKTGLFKT